MGFGLFTIQLGSERAAHIFYRGKGAHDQAHRRYDFLRRAIWRLPLRAHGQRIFPHGNGNTQLRAQLHAHGLHGAVQVGVFARFAASGHPVGAEFDPRQVNGSRQQVGDALGHGHAARCRRIQYGQRCALAHAHGLARHAGVVGQRDSAVGHRHLPGANHLVAVRQAAHGTVANGDKKTLAGHRGMAQHPGDGVLQGDVSRIQRLPLMGNGLHIALHFGRFAQQHIHGHLHRVLGVGRLIGYFADRLRGARIAFQVHITHYQVASLGRDAHYGKGATLALAESLELRQALGRNGQHVTLLAFVAPNFLGRQAAFFQRDAAQIKARATARVVHQLRESIAQAACAYIVNRQNGVGLPQSPAVVDDFLRAAFYFGVAALYRIEVQMRGIGATAHGAGRAATHANTHARAAQLHQQRACRKADFVRQSGINRAQPARNHDGLVVAHVARLLASSRLGGDGLLVFAKIPAQIGAAKFVVERCAAQGAFGHDLQRAGNVLGLAAGLVAHAAPQFGHGKARQSRFGLGAAAGCAFVADFSARASRCARKWRNGRGMVVRFHLHQHVLQGVLRGVAHAVVGGLRGHKALAVAAFHHGGVVAVGHHRVLGRKLFGVADHAEQGFVHLLPVDGEFGIENLVATMLAVGLGKHHQLHIRGVALLLGKGFEQVVDFIVSQCQPPFLVGLLQRLAACIRPSGEDIHMRHGCGIQTGKQVLSSIQRGQNAFGHAVVQQRLDGLALRICQRRAMQKILGATLDAMHAHRFGQAAVAGNIGGFAGPRRNRAHARRDDDAGICPALVLKRLAIGEQLLQLLLAGCIQRPGAFNPMDVAGIQGAHFGRNLLDVRQQLLATEGGQGIAACERSDEGLHGRGRRQG